MSTNTPPTTWNKKYIEDDKKNVLNILLWLDDKSASKTLRERTRISLSKSTGLSPSIITQILSGAYNAPPTKYLNKIMDSINHWNSKSVQPDSLIETTVYTLVNVACKKARDTSSFTIVAGAVGVGKTCCLIDYVKRNPGCIYLRGISSMNSAALIDELLSSLSLRVTGNTYQKLKSITNAFSGSNRLIVLDEADMVPAKTLETLRIIRDVSEIGILLSGTQALRAAIGLELGQFDQIRSRVTFWPPIIKCLSTEDITALSRKHLSNIKIHPGESFADIVNTLEKISKGSARVLVENLFPNIKAALKNHPEWNLECALIRNIAEKFLGYS